MHPRCTKACLVQAVVNYLPEAEVVITELWDQEPVRAPWWAFWTWWQRPLERNRIVEVLVITKEAVDPQMQALVRGAVDDSRAAGVVVVTYFAVPEPHPGCKG